MLLLTGCVPNMQQQRWNSNPGEFIPENLLKRIEYLEQRLNSSTPDPTDPKAPAGPLRSLTLRLDSTDDRLRLYWADGQRSDLSCSKEGLNTWACG